MYRKSAGFTDRTLVIFTRKHMEQLSESIGSSVINRFTCSGYSAQLLPGCAWIFGNLYMHVGKSIFMSPWLVGFTWYMGMMSESRKINTNTIRNKTNALDFGRLPYCPSNTKARAERGRVGVTSLPPKVKVYTDESSYCQDLFLNSIIRLDIVVTTLA